MPHLKNRLNLVTFRADAFRLGVAGMFSAFLGNGLYS